MLAYSQAVDMRKSFNGLLGEAKLRFEEDPLSGTLFLFLNRSRTIVKVLWWDRTGWCVFGKRLERGRFELRRHEELQELSAREFELLLDGVLRRVHFSRECTIPKM